MRAKPKQKTTGNERGGAGEPKKPAKPRRGEARTRKAKANNPKRDSQLKRKQTREIRSPQSRSQSRAG